MSNYKEALAFAAAYCSASEHCRSEVLEKASRFELNHDEQAKMIQILQQEGFLDEKRYAKAFVHDKIQYNKWGKIKIRYYLQQKGIPSELIENTLATIPEEDYATLLLTLLRQKKPSIKSKSPQDLKEKLFRYASGRGFETTLISRCLKNTDRDEETL